MRLCEHQNIWYYWILNSFVCKHWNLYLHSKLLSNRTQSAHLCVCVWVALRPLQSTSASKHEWKKETFHRHARHVLWILHRVRQVWQDSLGKSIFFSYHKLKSLTIIFKSCIVEMKCTEMKISFVQIVNLYGKIVVRNTGKMYFHVVTLKRSNENEWNWLKLSASLFSWKSFNECGIRSHHIIAIQRNFRSCSFHRETFLRISSHFYCSCRTFWMR